MSPNAVVLNGTYTGTKGTLSVNNGGTGIPSTGITIGGIMAKGGILRCQSANTLTTETNHTDMGYVLSSGSTTTWEVPSLSLATGILPPEKGGTGHDLVPNENLFLCNDTGVPVWRSLTPNDVPNGFGTPVPPNTFLQSFMSGSSLGTGYAPLTAHINPIQPLTFHPFSGTVDSNSSSTCFVTSAGTDTSPDALVLAFIGNYLSPIVLSVEKNNGVDIRVHVAPLVPTTSGDPSHIYYDGYILVYNPIV